MSLPQPQAASVQTHIVEDVDDWASFCELSGTLRLLDSQPDAVQSTISHQFSKDKLDACMFASALVVEHLHALFDAEERLPHLGRDPRTTIIGPFVMDVLKEVIPESEAHFDPLYARAIYPCQASMPAARWLLPHYGHATSILTYPISLPGGTSSSALSRSLGEGSLNDKQGSADDEPGSASQYGKEGNELTSLTYESFCSSGALFDRYRRPLGNAHLLSRHGYSRDHALLAILCVATEDEIYDLLCSALMQRRAFGIRDVVIGFTFSPQRSHLQLVVGWLEDSASHACVEVHVAHARPPRDGEQPAHALGIFDLSRLPSSQALALFLISMRSHLLASADAASCQVADVECPLRNTDSGTWRIDLLHEVERNAARTCSLDPNRCVTKWLDHCMSAQSADARVPHISYDNSPHIGEAPVAIATHLRGGSESAWSVAGLQPRYKGPDRFMELVADRGIAFDAFPTVFDKVGHVQENAVLKRAWDSLICPRICEVGPLPTETLAVPCKYITAFGTKSHKFPEESVEPAAHVLLKPHYVARWYEYNQEKALEQAVRFAYKLDRLTEVDKTTREIVVLALPQLLYQSELAARGRLKACSEMESRQTWDATIQLFLDGITDETSKFDKTHKPNNGTIYHIHNRLERKICFPKNHLFDLLPMGKSRSHTNVTAARLAVAFAQLSTLVGAVTFTPMPIDHGKYSDDIRQAIEAVEAPLTEWAMSLRIKDQWGPIQQRLALYVKHSKTQSDIESRVLSDFTYSICDGLTFVEIPDVFDDSDRALAQELQAFAIVGNLDVTQNTKIGRAVGDNDMNPHPDEQLPSSVPQIVHIVRDFAQKIRTTRSHSGQDAERSAETAFPEAGRTYDSQGPLQGLCLDVAAPSSATDPAVLPTVIGPTRPIELQQGTPIANPPPHRGGAARNPPEQASWKSVCLPILFREYKRSLVSPLQGLNQARIYLLSAAAFFAALDMFEVAVFAIATVGSKGRLLCGWAEKVMPSDHSFVKVVHHIADVHCPEWDLSDSSDAIDFAAFLALLRTRHIPDVVQRFEEKRSAFVQAWREGDRKRFHWTMAHQQEYSKAYKDAEAAKKQQQATSSKLKEMESLQNSDSRQARMGKNEDKSTVVTSTPEAEKGGPNLPTSTHLAEGTNTRGGRSRRQNQTSSGGSQT